MGAHSAARTVRDALPVAREAGFTDDVTIQDPLIEEPLVAYEHQSLFTPEPALPSSRDPQPVPQAPSQAGTGGSHRRPKRAGVTMRRRNAQNPTDHNVEILAVYTPPPVPGKRVARKPSKALQGARSPRLPLLEGGEQRPALSPIHQTPKQTVQRRASVGRRSLVPFATVAFGLAIAAALVVVARDGLDRRDVGLASKERSLSTARIAAQSTAPVVPASPIALSATDVPPPHRMVPPQEITDSAKARAGEEKPRRASESAEAKSHGAKDRAPHVRASRVSRGDARSARAGGARDRVLPRGHRQALAKEHRESTHRKKSAGKVMIASTTNREHTTRRSRRQP